MFQRTHDEDDQMHTLTFELEDDSDDDFGELT